MADEITFKTPDEIGQQYLDHLKAIKPEVNTDQTDSDWWIRSRVVGGVIAGMYSDLKKISDDAFPQSARREALEKHLITYFGTGFRQPTVAEGIVKVTGNIGTNYPVGTQFVYQPNGNTYQSTEDFTLSATAGLIPIQSISEGQNQNLLSGSLFSLPSAPSGSDATAAASGDISDGRDVESNDEASERILDRIRTPIAGGTITDYKQFARDADPSVTDSNVIRYIYGLGTVGVVITAGTTDIDQAIDNGEAIVRIPSDALVDDVQAYVDAKKPLTDCAHVLKPSLIPIDVNVRVRYADGDGSTIPVGSTITQEELVIREVKRAIYKTPPGGRQFGATGFVVASEIEEVIDSGLSSSPYQEGSYFQILVDRQVEDLSVSGANRMILPTELAEPGVITVLSF